MNERQLAAMLAAQERLARGQRRLAPGSIGGRSEQAQATPRRPTVPSLTVIPEERSWYLPGYLQDFDETESGRWTPRMRTNLTIIVNELVVPGSTDSEIEVLKLGAHLADYTIPAGVTFYEAVIDEPFRARIDCLSFFMTAGGEDAQQLTQTAVFI